jgi:deoxyribose-phosphate aldolase
MMKFNKKNVAKLIDHTDIRLKATSKDIKKLCDEAKEYGFRSVCVRSKWVKFAKNQLKGTKIMISVLVDDPMGLDSHQNRMKVCKKAKIDGAHNLDVVMNIVDLKYERYNKVFKDLKDICKILPTKVIIGSGFLTDEEVKKASEIVKKAKCFCVKTATDKDPLEHREIKEKIHHLKIMKKSAPGLKVKASGKIKTLSDVKEAVKAGASIIGTSSGVKIMKGY